MTTAASLLRIAQALCAVLCMGSPAVAEMCVLVGGACIDDSCTKESTPSYYCEVADCACYDDTAWCGDDDYIASLVYGVLTLSGGGQQP